MFGRGVRPRDPAAGNLRHWVTGNPIECNIIVIPNKNEIILIHDKEIHEQDTKAKGKEDSRLVIDTIVNQFRRGKDSKQIELQDWTKVKRLW